MRYHIIRALFEKEVRRHLANRGGLVLAVLLVLAAVLLTLFNPTSAEAGVAGGEPIGGIHHCYIQYPEETEFIRHLAARLPDNLKAQVRFEIIPPNQLASVITYPPGVGAIRIKESKSLIQFNVWHPPENSSAMAPYELWFYRSAREILQDMATKSLKKKGIEKAPHQISKETDGRMNDLWAVRDSFGNLTREANELSPDTTPTVEIERSGLGSKPLDYRSAIATAMVVFALYFTCCYLLPTLNCEERERGVLLAQALSPASPVEIVAAKFLFYPVAGIILASILAGIYNPNVLNSLFFWLSLLAMAGGFLGIGMTVSTLAKTQRSAFMGSMCYLISVSLFLFICSQNGIPFLSNLAIEFHGPVILHAAMTRNIMPVHWSQLVAAMALACCWMTLAAWLFRRRGWQ